MVALLFFVMCATVGSIVLAAATVSSGRLAGIKYYLLKFDDNGYFQNYKRRDSIIQKELDKFGYFVLIASEKMTASEALSKYRDRDAIEKLFRTIKKSIGHGYVSCTWNGVNGRQELSCVSGSDHME